MEDERKTKAKNQRLHMFYGGGGGKWSPSVLEGMVWIMWHCIFETVNSLVFSHYYCIMKRRKRGRSRSRSPSYESRRKHHSLSRRKYRQRSHSSSSSLSSDRRYKRHLHRKENNFTPNSSKYYHQPHKSPPKSPLSHRHVSSQISPPMKFSLSYQNHHYSGMYAQHPIETAAASYPTAAFVKETHVGNRDCYESGQTEMENEADEHVALAQNLDNLSVLAFAAMLGDEAIEEN